MKFTWGGSHFRHVNVSSGFWALTVPLGCWENVEEGFVFSASSERNNFTDSVFVSVFCLSLRRVAAALQALKRKKRFEKQLAQIDGTLSTIEFQREALENANTNTEVLKNMGYAAKAMKAAHENMYETFERSYSLLFLTRLCESKSFLWLSLSVNFHRDIDKVDDLMADITEQQEVAQEISDVISRPVGFGEDYDEVREKHHKLLHLYSSSSVSVLHCWRLKDLLIHYSCTAVELNSGWWNKDWVKYI